jgi:hypothetical protein
MSSSKIIRSPECYPISEVVKRMKCPSCGGVDIRASKRHPRFGLFYEALGYERYRCRECRNAFWKRPPDNLEERNRRRRQRGWSPFFQTRSRRRVIEVALFVTMLLLFFFTIRYLVTKTEGSSPAGIILFSPVPNPLP